MKYPSALLCLLLITSLCYSRRLVITATEFGGDAPRASQVDPRTARLPMPTQSQRRQKEMDEHVQQMIADMASIVRETAAAGAFFQRDPPELQFSDAVGVSPEEEAWGERLAKADLDTRIGAARVLWRQHSRAYSRNVLALLCPGPVGGQPLQALRREINQTLRPESIRQELHDGDYRWGAWLAFLRPHRDLVPVLLDGLKTKPHYRAATVLALGKSGDHRALDPLLRLLRSKDYQAPGEAAQALGYLGDPSAESALIDALANDNAWRQVKACGALARIGTSRALPRLERLVNTKGYTGVLDVRGMAMYAVVRIEKRQRQHNGASRGDGVPTNTLHGHAGYIWDVAFSPNGKLLASASDDRTVRLWDPATGKNTASFPGHARQMMHVAFLPDGRLATAGWGGDGTVRLLDVATGKTTGTIGTTRGAIDSLVISPDGKLMASYDVNSRGAQVWEMATSKAAYTLAGAGDVLGFSPDGRMLATDARESEDIQLWDLATRKVARRLRGHVERPLAGAFSPDGRTLASAGDWTLRLWDVRTGKAQAVHRGDSRLRGVAFSPDGRWLASAETAEPVRLWDQNSGKVTVLEARGPVAFSPDGKLLATGAKDGTTILLWDVQKLRGHRP